MRGRSEASLTEQSSAPGARSGDPSTTLGAPRAESRGEATDVDLAREGDRDAFERLYRLHVGRVHGLACRMAGPEAAEDLTQDVFVRAWEKLPGFRSESQFGTWLYRLAMNVIVENWRKGAGRRSWRQDDDAIDDVPAGPEDPAFAIDFEAAVKRLPRAARRVFLLHDVEGYKHREIGKLAGITSGTSKGQLHRARNMLRRYLERGTRT